MIINNTNIVTAYGVTLLSRDFQNAEITNYVNWLDAANTPSKTRDEKFTFSSCSITILVEGSNESEVLDKISYILDLAKSGSLKFSDMDYYFDFTLDDSSNKKICEVAYELTIKLKINFKFKQELVKEFTGSNSFAIQNAGTCEVPCIVEVTPTADMIDLTITGLEDEAIVIKNLTAGKTIKFNYDSVLQDGTNKFMDVDMWNFPRLKKGTNNITLSKTNLKIKIIFKERMI